MLLMTQVGQSVVMIQVGQCVGRRPHVADDTGKRAVKRVNGCVVVVVESVFVDDDDAADTSSSSSIVLSDAEARRLHHSKSWPPQSADGRRAATNLGGVATSAVTVYGNHQFNFTLPHNTSTERLHRAAAADGARFADHGIIYLSSPTSSVGDEPQIAYITDELCRIFCTDTVSLDDDDGDVDSTGADASAAVESTDSELSASVPRQCLELSDAEMSASVQQQCLPVISCDCDAVDDASSSSSSAANSSADPTNPSELSTDAPTASDYVEPTSPSSATELPCPAIATAAAALSPDSPTDVVSGHSSTNSRPADDDDDDKDVRAASEDVAVATSEECCRDGADMSRRVADDNTESASADSSLRPHRSKQAKTDDGKGRRNLSHAWNSGGTAAAGCNAELGRDHER